MFPKVGPVRTETREHDVCIMYLLGDTYLKVGYQKRLVHWAVNGALVCEGRGSPPRIQGGCGGEVCLGGGAAQGPGKEGVGGHGADRQQHPGRALCWGTMCHLCAGGCGARGLLERSFGGAWGRSLARFFHGRQHFLRSRPRVSKL